MLNNFVAAEGQSEAIRGGPNEVTERGEFQDKILPCADCGEEFTWGAGEQAFFMEKGFTTEPKRCKECRQVNKQHRAEADAIKEGGG